MLVQHRDGEPGAPFDVVAPPACPPVEPNRLGEREPLMNIAVVAVRLGVTVRHIRRLVNEHRIPYIKWGHLLRFDPADIETWLDRARHGR